MKDFSVRVEGLGKKYTIGGAINPSYVTLRDVVVQAATRIVTRAPPASPDQRRSEIWALKEVSFEAHPGEIVGIIGHNGSGKSTLLKVLSRITDPTEGRATIVGRVASLLEVGTGFHLELTGRENIYLNGAILGMSKAEISRKFDDIVDFAEIEQFLDTPVKRYSSGMSVRLGFAIAAHLEPDVLIVDEVLAVGDASFQRKCLSRLGVESKKGRTILFVSHDADAIIRLCSRVLWLDRGRLVGTSDNPRELCGQYLRGDEKLLRSSYSEHANGFVTNDYFRLKNLRVCDGAGVTITHPVSNDGGACVEIEFELYRHEPSLVFGIVPISESGQQVFWSFMTDVPDERWPALSVGHNVLRVMIPPHLLNGGLYKIELVAVIQNQGWIIAPGSSPCWVQLHIAGGLSQSAYWRTSRGGVTAPIIQWRAEQHGDSRTDPNPPVMT